eukprot:2666700-Pyramimonas_sp.AAC.1
MMGLMQFPCGVIQIPNKSTVFVMRPLPLADLESYMFLWQSYSRNVRLIHVHRRASPLLVYKH